MIRIVLCKGVPASGKSTWAKEEVRQGKGTWKRVNRDDLRAMIDGGVYSPSNEKLVLKIRDLIIQNSVKNGVNVIIDDTNIRDKGKNFADVCALVEPLNVDCQIIEKVFYIDVEEALARDAKRENPVGEKVIRTFWHEAGSKQFVHYKPQVQTYYGAAKAENSKAKFDPKLPRAILVDLDGTLAHVGDRNVYDASNCDEVDVLNEPVAETVKLYYNAGTKIIFCSGRIDKYREPSVRFIEKHLPGMEYQLFMRNSGDKRKDNLVKDEIFQKEINGKYNVLLVLDDRDSVIELWRKKLGLTAFQVNYGNF